jgi:malate permease and related proteins
MNMPFEMWQALGMIALGWIMQVSKRLPEQAADAINQLVLQICLPALILTVVPKLKFDWRFLMIAVIAWVVMALSALAIRGICRAMHYGRDVEGCLLLTAVLGNTAFLGMPITAAYLPEGLSFAVIYDQLGSFLVFSSFGLLVAAHYGGGKSLSATQTIKRVLSFPSFLALLLALIMIAMDWQFPNLAGQFIGSVSKLLVPLAMFSVGLTLKLIPPSGYKTPLLIGLSVKMLLAPLMALALGRLLSDPLVAQTVCLQASMPPMVTAAALATNAKLAPQLAGAMAGFGVILGVFWAPVLLAMLG